MVSSALRTAWTREQALQPEKVGLETQMGPHKKIRKSKKHLNFKLFTRQRATSIYSRVSRQPVVKNKTKTSQGTSRPSQVDRRRRAKVFCSTGPSSSSRTPTSALNRTAFLAPSKGEMRLQPNSSLRDRESASRCAFQIMHGSYEEGKLRARPRDRSRHDRDHGR